MERCIRCLDQSMKRLSEDDRELITQWTCAKNPKRLKTKEDWRPFRGSSPGALRIRAFGARQ